MIAVIPMGKDLRDLFTINRDVREFHVRYMCTVVNTDNRENCKMAVFVDDRGYSIQW